MPANANPRPAAARGRANCSKYASSSARTSTTRHGRMCPDELLPHVRRLRTADTATNTHHGVAADAAEWFVELRPIEPGVERRMMSLPNETDDVKAFLSEAEAAADRVEPGPKDGSESVADDHLAP